jgi:hypothetical protein
MTIIVGFSYVLHLFLGLAGRKWADFRTLFEPSSVSSLGDWGTARAGIHLGSQPGCLATSSCFRWRKRLRSHTQLFRLQQVN